MLDEKNRARIKEIEALSRFPTGIGRIDRGECPVGGLNALACMFCPFGHMLECHYPYTCEHVECSHYQQEVESAR